MRIMKPIIVCCCAAWTALSGQSAIADDTEVFFSGSSSSSSVIRPNILLILDTSGSMNRTTTFVSSGNVEPYDADEDYSDGPADCDSDRVYYWPIANGTAPTSCSAPGLQSFDRSDYLKCKAAVSGLDGSQGYYGGSDYFARLKRNSGSNYTWQTTLNISNGRAVECKADAIGTMYGESMGSADNKYPKASAGSSSSDSWTTTATNSWWNTNAGTQYYLFSPNYIRYNNDPPVSGTRFSRMDVVKTAVTNLLNTVSDVNIGLMRYDSDAHGGMVVKPIAELTDTYKSELIATVNAFAPSGGTPLSETLYEAHQYLSGGAVEFGDTSESCSAISNADSDANGSCVSGGTVNTPSVATSLTSGSSPYASPLDSNTACTANNHIIYLTDGLPTSDVESDSTIASLIGHACTDAGTSNGQGICLEELSEYMKDTDLLGDGTNSSVKTHYIGFGADLVTANAVSYLSGAATAGGGQFHTAGNITSLSTAFQSILNETVADTSATFVSPSVAVNSFNKTQILEDMYVAMFKPTLSRHWPGNLKKFKLREVDDELTVVGQGSSTTSVSNESAVDPDTGFFKPTTRDIWQMDSVTNEADKEITTKGGAANLIPAPSLRNLYTYMGSTNKQLSATENLFNTSNKDTIVAAGLGTTDASSPTSEQLINWARGQDIHDDDNDSNTTESRNVMGDPIHSQPAVVIYGNDSSATTDLAKLNDARVYVTTNDGYLHSFDVVSGEEKWAFIPSDLMNKLLPLYQNAETINKEYALDGDIRVLKYDVDGDGIVDTGTGQNDRVILYFSQGRGGPNYYAIDVTEKDNPKFLWKLDSTSAIGGSATFGSVVNKSWSTPTLGRVNTGGTQNPQKLVLIFGGGYDITEDSQVYSSSDAYGKAIFMVDAIKGTVLWRAGATGSGADLELTKMTHAIPSNITVLDANGDGWSDRMYVGDMAGQLWRFDITSHVDNPSPTADIPFDVNGGVIASLGHQSGDTGTASNRSFYNAPDVAKITVYGDASYYNISIGSGDRALPKTNVTTEDRFYAIRDYRLGAMSQASFDALTPTLDSDLTEISRTTGGPSTSSGIASKGWKLPMSSAEKVLSSSITLNGVVMFTSFVPAATVTNACLPTTGSARSYTLNLTTGTKFFSDLYETFATTGLPSQVNIVAKDRILATGGDSDETDDDGGGDEDSDDPAGPAGTCLSGVTILGNCVDFGTRVKTFWQESGAN